MIISISTIMKTVPAIRPAQTAARQSVPSCWYDFVWRSEVIDLAMTSFISGLPKYEGPEHESGASMFTLLRLGETCGSDNIFCLSCKDRRLSPSRNCRPVTSGGFCTARVRRHKTLSEGLGNGRPFSELSRMRGT
jgi:hypothetical protein